MQQISKLPFLNDFFKQEQTLTYSLLGSPCCVTPLVITLIQRVGQGPNITLDQCHHIGPKSGQPLHEGARSGLCHFQHRAGWPQGSTAEPQLIAEVQKLLELQKWKKFSLFLPYSPRTYSTMKNIFWLLVRLCSAETHALLWPAKQKGWSKIRFIFINIWYMHFRFKVLVYSLKVIWGCLFEKNIRILLFVILQLVI